MDDFRRNLAMMNAVAAEQRRQKIGGYAVAFVIVVVFGLIITAFSWNAKMREDDCEKIGGTYLTNGRYAEPTCIKDGRIVIIWKKDGTKVENP